MRELDAKIKLFVGSRIEYESELDTIREIVNMVEAESVSAVIIANIHLSGRQIDIIFATEKQVLVIEVKNHNRPLKGTENGTWQFKSATGEWRNTRNYYQQTLNASYALKDSMSAFSNAEVQYPTAALVFVPSIPNGSSIPSSDYKVKVGSLEVIRNLGKINQNSTWSLQQWRGFSNSQNLTPVFSLESARSSKLMSATETLSRYESEFLKTYSNESKKLVHFNCYVNEEVVYSKKVIEYGSSGKDLLIIGPSGCAKSMLAREIGAQSFEKGQVPIIIEAKYFNKDFGNLLNQEVCLLNVSSFGQLVSTCKSLNKRLAIIIDGFNECPHAFRHRLYRCIRATSFRYRTVIILTSQKAFKELNNLKCETIKIDTPNTKVKNAIANIDNYRKVSSDITKLIELAKSGFEAEIIGEIKELIVTNSNRFDVFEMYARKKLGKSAQVGVTSLSQIASYMTENLTFSMSLRDLERFQVTNEWPTDIFNLLKLKNLLAQRSDNVSFEHELFLDIFSAEAIIRACGNSADDV